MQKKKIQKNEKKKFKALALTKAAQLLGQGKISKEVYNSLLKVKSYDEYEDFYLRVNDPVRSKEYLDVLQMKTNLLH